MTSERGRISFYLTIGCSSILLFLIQPVITKAILPAFGGSAGVWVTAMLFFQAVLLMGYFYSYLLTRFCNRKAQSLIHLVLLLISIFLLPVKPHLEWAESGMRNPALSILAVLLASVGLPCFLLCSVSPLLQSWYVTSYTGVLPYRLFAFSNAGSVIALLAYPFLIEPLLPASVQLQIWSASYAVLVVIACTAAFIHWVRNPIEEAVDTGLSRNRPFLWIGLAACASVLWLAVANHLSQEVAPVPFLWVLPLSLYLLSFILCFEGWYRPVLFRWLLPAAWIAGCYSIAQPAGLRLEISTFSVTLFIWCMFCHGELTRTKPQRRGDLTFFYLMLAFGGALGGVFVGVVAPNMFSTFLELPIGIVASVILALPLIYRVTSPARLARVGIVAAAAFIVATRFQSGSGAVAVVRNFYGALHVSDTGAGEAAFRSLYNGRTLHGVEFLSSTRSRIPTTYYGPDSGAGKTLLAGGKSRRAGIVGLGAGTLAVYGRTGDSFRFYEINPAVIQIAEQSFHFLDASPARIEVVAGDGRLALEKESSDSFDVIVLDAFSDDSIPVHLMTKEAFRLYFRLLHPDGVLAIHLTNRYLDLEPVVEALAAAFGKGVQPVHNLAEPELQILAADWALVYGHATAGRKSSSKTPHARLWTDDYSNLFQVLK
jgi:SAM-dependent methyltransferase